MNLANLIPPAFRKAHYYGTGKLTTWNSAKDYGYSLITGLALTGIPSQSLIYVMLYESPSFFGATRT